MKRCLILSLIAASCASTPEVTRHALDAPDQFLVTDGARSYLILDGPEGFEVVAKVDEVVLGTSENVWVLRTQTQTQPQADCACVMEASATDGPTQACVSEVPKPMIFLDRLDGTRATPFTDPSSPESSATSSFRLLGIWDGKAMLEMCSSIFVCGAPHPNMACTFRSVSLTDGAVAGIDTLVTSYDVERARRALHAEDPELEADVELAPSSARVVFGGSAASREILVTAPTCYACSDGDWSSYTVSTWQPAGGREELPRPVAAFFLAHDAVPIWTEVGPQNRNLIEAAFAH